MTFSGVAGAAGAARLPKALLASGAAASDIQAEAVSAVQLRVGDLYWKQDGNFGWTLGQVSAFDAQRQRATFCLIDEATGEPLRRSQEEEEAAAGKEKQLEQQVDLQQTPLFAANPLFSTAADMTSLRHLHEAALAKNLEDRAALQNQRPYTFMANVLIAVNPLRQLPEPDKMLFVGQPLDRCPPHPYNVAESAYRQLCAVRAVMQNQSIIISGESGSGKTETSKIILDFLTMRAVHNPALSSASASCTSDDEMEPELTAHSRPVLGCMGPPGSSTLAMSYPQSSGKRKLSPVAVGERLMETIPILESFGNAKTHRNHNSSRFGKHVPSREEPTGVPAAGERNFHVFYELLHSDDTEYLENALHLKAKSPEDYSYLNQSGCMRSDLIDDGENFRNLKSALQFIGIRESAQHEIFRLVAGLLHMGNIHISQEDTEEGETACIREDDLESQEAVRHASELLGVSREQLTESILLKRIMTRGSRRNSIYFIKRDVRNAVYSRDTIAKTIYENTFTWLMWECAAALDYDSFRSDVVPYIGVLDIFGFEDFEPKNRNSFEQLLINYANETLQSLFNACIFEAEQELYKSEHIYHPTNHSLSFPFPLAGQPLKVKDPENEIDFLAEQVAPSGDLVAYSDNRECLNLIASRHGGLFATIDNVSRLPMPSDRKLNERLHTLFKRHPCFPTPHPKDIRDTFLIRHYAGTVSYTIDSFVDKTTTLSRTNLRSC
ncbi:myosin-like protein [Phytophthora cinnamomi]|uniref:myosin-like protein n=1 Tax=Phytophthora cinnamomi TaxID=4785 RepID=UPI003559BE30|nr:myosin-like protein [Phytophthora cinnamomi]